MRLSSFIFILFALSACNKQSHIGFFTSNPENQAAFAGRELTLNADGSFDMNSWTDSFSIVTDEDGNVICNDKKSKGSGNYTPRDGKLHLTFTNIDYANLDVSYTKETNQDSSWHILRMELSDEKRNKVPSLMLHLLDNKREPIQFLHCNEKKPCEFIISSNSHARGVALSMMSTKDFIFMFNEQGEGDHTFTINRCLGYYSQGTEISLPYKMTRNGIEYTNEQGRLVKLNRAKG